MLKTISFCLAVLLISTQPNATEIANLNQSHFKLGESKYLVYMEDSQTKEVRFSSIWQRNTAIKEKNGQSVIEITQKWRSADKRFNREIKSVNQLADFSPLSHWSRNESGVEAYLFDNNRIYGDSQVESNLKKDFSMPTTSTPLNWELDIETFQLLDFAEGKTFSLNFYHPGSKTAPANYSYTVTGSETLQLAGLPPVECWTLRIDYDKESHAIFWIDKQSKQMLKMQEKWQKFTRFKYLLPA